MPIEAKEVINIEPKSFDKIWVRKIEIAALKPGTEISAEVLLIPYNDSGEVSEDNSLTIHINNILEKSEDHTSNIAKAMYFILEAVNEAYHAEDEV